MMTKEMMYLLKHNYLLCLVYACSKIQKVSKAAATYGINNSVSTHKKMFLHDITVTL